MKQKSFLISFFVIWIGIGIYFSLPYFQQITWLIKLNLRFPLEKKNINLYGADYYIYNQLASTDKNTKILFLASDSFLQSRINFFLYPRKISTFYKPAEILKINPQNYDYLAVFYQMPKFAGAVQGLNFSQKYFSWETKDLYQIDKKFNRQPAVDLKAFENQLFSSGGVRLYKLGNRN